MASYVARLGIVAVFLAAYSIPVSFHSVVAVSASHSVAQQLIITAWDILFGIAMVAWVFGWTGGKQLVRQSYETAEAKRDELKEQRAARRDERRHRNWLRH